MSRRPAITSLLNGHDVKIGFASTSVTSSRASSRLIMRAAVAPAKPPPITTIRGGAPCARSGRGMRDALAPAAAAAMNWRRVGLGAALILPPPLWGRVGVGGRGVRHGRASTPPTPTPDPSPQGGGEKRRAASLTLRAIPGCDRLDLVIGEALGDAVHHGRGACPAAERLHGCDDRGGVFARKPRHRRVDAGLRRMAAGA